MTTLSLKNFHMTVAQIVEATNFVPSIPAYMEYVYDGASILFRRKEDMTFIEHWCHIGGYWDDAFMASDVEVEAYSYTHNAFLLDDMADLPEPIDILDQELFLDECDFNQPTEGDYIDFVHDFNLLQMEAA